MNAVITGASKGIGRAIALHFASMGANIAICSRNTEELDNFTLFVKELYPNVQVLALSTDMSKKESIVEFAHLIKKNWDKVDVLVNNAGVFMPCSLLEVDQEDAFRTMMDTNLYSAYYMGLEMMPLLLKDQSGHIFNVASIASFMPYGGYAVSKHAMLGYSRVLREELKDKGIKVTAVMPGATYTNSWEGAGIPESRFMTAEDIASTVWSCYQLGPNAVVEELIIRPQLGDI
jgi:short-subunit dehydrogenase